MTIIIYNIIYWGLLQRGYIHGGYYKDAQFYKDDWKGKTLQEKFNHFRKGRCELSKIQIHKPKRYLHIKQNPFLDKQWALFCKWANVYFCKPKHSKITPVPNDKAHTRTIKNRVLKQKKNFMADVFIISFLTWNDWFKLQKFYRALTILLRAIRAILVKIRW